MKHRKILFVCTGNTCRSPMAEAALKAELKRRKISWYRVQSAGLSASEGHTMSANSAQALREAKIPYSEKFTACQLTKEMIEEAHAVVCMTGAQQRALETFPNVTSFPALCQKEIPDPYGQGIDVYRVTLRAIRECLPRIIQICCPKVEKEGEKI
ncbi:MAG: low molecular weight protein arginine phosphatase [Clostridia bacterium]|nr:low molecular weight protein arginine phosphatase [Clostridia bacterium]